MTKTKILLFSEGVTLSQIVRLVTLGRALDPNRYEVTFACSDFNELVFQGTGFGRVLVHSLDPKAVLRAMRSGRRLYNKRTLLKQVEEDLAVFAQVSPDLVVGDFRWSLAVSAPVFGVPHAALINAYWSPFASRSAFPVPDHPIVRLLGEALTEKYFPAAIPRVFRHFAEPVNQARRAYGLPEIGSLLQVLTHGDYVLYADPSELVPTPGAPETHEHIGFVPWSPDSPLPPALSRLPEGGRPVVYATVGSSGSIDTLPLVVEALSQMNVTGLVATAGRKTLTRVPDNVHVADFFPGDLAARRASLVISNGGSSTSYQALTEGVPVLGLASNLDQYLAMLAIENAGAGQLVRARSATVASIRSAAQTLLDSPPHHEGAKKVQRSLAGTSSADKFRSFVARVTSSVRSRRNLADPGRSPPAAGLRALRMLALVLACLGGVLGGNAHAEGPPTPASKVGEIRFSSRVPGTGGQVICALFREGGWLKKPVLTVKSPVRGHDSTCVFVGVESGMYAIVAFHDENTNGDIDKNFLGIPTEDWCTSRNAKAIFGPPSFSAAKFLSRGGILRLSGSM